MRRSPRSEADILERETEETLVVPEGIGIRRYGGGKAVNNQRLTDGS